MLQQTRVGLAERIGTLLLLGVLVLGPFLHAHLGQSSVAGFHVDGVTQLHHDSCSFEKSQTPDSPAIGVSSSIVRDGTSKVSQKVDLESVISIAWIEARSELLLAFGTHWLNSNDQASYQREGTPPPAHAPPKFA